MGGLVLKQQAITEGQHLLPRWGMEGPLVVCSNVDFWEEQILVTQNIFSVYHSRTPYEYTDHKFDTVVTYNTSLYQKASVEDPQAVKQLP